MNSKKKGLGVNIKESHLKKKNNNYSSCYRNWRISGKRLSMYKTTDASAF